MSTLNYYESLLHPGDVVRAKVQAKTSHYLLMDLDCGNARGYVYDNVLNLPLLGYNKNQWLDVMITNVNRLGSIEDGYVLFPVLDEVNYLTENLKIFTAKINMITPRGLGISISGFGYFSFPVYQEFYKKMHVGDNIKVIMLSKSGTKGDLSIVTIQQATVNGCEVEFINLQKDVQLPPETDRRRALFMEQRSAAEISFYQNDVTGIRMYDLDCGGCKYCIYDLLEKKVITAWD